MKPSSDEARRIELGLGHYVAAVVAALREEGIVMDVFDVEAPKMVTDDDSQGNQVLVFQDASAVLRPGFDFTDRVDQVPGMLAWEADSGWFFFLDRDLVGWDDLVASARWLGDRVVPEPRRVVQFMSSVLLDHHTAGSTERPFYRTAGQDGAALIERLTPYITFSAITSSPDPWRSRIHEERDRWTRDRITSGLAQDVGDRVYTIPVRGSELAALADLAALLNVTAQPSKLGRLAYNLAEDFKARASKGATSLEPPYDSGVREAIRLHRLSTERE